MSRNFHFPDIFHHLQVQVLKKLDFDDFVRLAESSKSANQLIETANILPIMEIPNIYIGHLYDDDKTKQKLPKYSLSKGGKSRIPKPFPPELLEKRVRFGVKTIMFVQITDWDCLQTLKMFEEGKVLNDEQLTQEQGQPKKTRRSGKFIPLNVGLDIVHLNTKTCQPSMLFRLFYVLKPKSLSLFHCDKYFLSQPAIQKIQEFKLQGSIDEDILISLEASKLNLQKVNWKEDFATGINRFLKEWYIGKRKIETVVIRVDDEDIDVKDLLKDLPCLTERRNDVVTGNKENVEEHPVYVLSRLQQRIAVELTPKQLSVRLID